MRSDPTVGHRSVIVSRVSLLLSLLGVLGACSEHVAQQSTPYTVSPPLGLPPVPVPPDDPMTVEKVELGRLLFYDRRVATQARSACADCHVPDHGFSGRDATMGFHRRAPTAFNRAYGRFEFWDGSAGSSLEELVRGVLQFLNDDAKRPYPVRLADVPEYRRAFQQAFGRAPDEADVIQALASFSRTLLAGDAPYDRFKAGDRSSLPVSAQRGKDTFFGKGACATCHSGPNFSDEEFHNIGIGQENPEQRFYPAGERGKPDFPELGRFNITHRIADRGAFKTPTLRELAGTAPYMHDGRFKTLREVVDYYDRGGPGELGQDPRIHPLGLSENEKSDLIAFLEALSSGRPPPARPVLPK